MSMFHDKAFPNESMEYRNARNKLLSYEKKLRKQNSEVTKMRSALPLGGKLKEDYIFDEIKGGKSIKTKFSSLFKAKKNTVIIYSMMYDPKWENACPSCTSILDGLDGSFPHVNDRVNFVVIGKAPIKKLNQFAKKRNWKHLRLLSSYSNTFNRDYFTEDSSGEQLPLINVFIKTPKGIFHYYSTEIFYIPPEKGQDPRHVDFVWPIWQLFDLTPEGRDNWTPGYSYPRK